MNTDKPRGVAKVCVWGGGGHSGHAPLEVQKNFVSQILLLVFAKMGPLRKKNEGQIR